MRLNKILWSVLALLFFSTVVTPAVTTYLDREALVISDNRLIIKDHSIGVNTTNMVASFNVEGDILARGTFSFGVVPTMTSFFIDSTENSKPSSARIHLDGEVVASVNARGLTLVIVDADDHSLVSSTTYDTYNNNTNATTLATAIAGMTSSQIGMLTSYDAYEPADNSTATDWFSTLNKAGLHMLYNSQGSQNTRDGGSQRHSYAAVFQKNSTQSSAKAIEQVELEGANHPRARIAGFLMAGTFYAGGGQTGTIHPSNGDGMGVMYSSDASGLGRMGFGIRAGGGYPIRVEEKAILGDTLFFESFANDGVRFERTESDLIFHVYDNDDDQLIFGDDNFSTKQFRFNFGGTGHANSWNGGGADYAEWFPAEEKIVSGDVVGINPSSGRVRKLRAGDSFLGIHSTQPGFVGNIKMDEEEAAQQAKTHALIGLSGQLEFDPSQVRLEGRLVYTLTDEFIGYLLASGKVLMR